MGVVVWARRGPEGSAGTGVAVVPGCAAPGSIGGRSLQLAVNVGVAVWEIVPVLRENGKRFSQALWRIGVPLGLLRVVWTSVGGTDARSACE